MTVKGISSQGVTLHISVDGSPTNWQKVGNITGFRGPGSGSSAVLDASSLDSTFKEKLIGLPDEGQLAVDINLDPDDAVHLACRTARKNKTLCEFKLTLSDSTPAVGRFYGYVLTFPLAGGVDQIVKVAIVIEIDGEVYWT